MSIRRLLLGLLGAATITLAACSSTGSSATPTPASTAVSEPASPAASGSAAAGLQGFCADVAAKLTATWPNVDAATAASLGPVLQTWASKPEVASQQADITTIATWLVSVGSGGAAASPPADVQLAFDHLKTFAGTNC